MNNRVEFLRGTSTILRPYNETTDLEPFTRWMNDPDMRDFLASTVFPITGAWEREQMNKLALDRSGNSVFLVIEKKDEEGPIGTMGLHRINWIDRTTSTGSFIGDEENRSKGYGTDAKMQLLNYAFTTLGLRVIRSGVIANNERSARALLKQGYTEVGRIPEWFFRNGAYHDERIFVLTPEAFAPVYAAWMTKTS